MTEAERRAEEDEYVRLAEALRNSKAYVAADELEPYWTARTVRVRNGTPTVSDGPAVQAALEWNGQQRCLMPVTGLSSSGK